MAQLVKNPPAMREIWVRSLGWKDPLEKGKATHSSVLACWIPWTVSSMGSQRVRRDFHSLHFTCFWKCNFQSLLGDEKIYKSSVTLSNYRKLEVSFRSVNCTNGNLVSKILSQNIHGSSHSGVIHRTENSLHYHQKKEGGWIIYGCLRMPI